jgi:DNA-binding NarL/FixJ family response regulator
MINLLLVDDHAVLRDGLKTIIESEDDINVIGEAVSGSDALNKVRELTPDIILMDINLPGMNGVEVTRILKQQYPHIKVLILTMHSHEEYFMSAIKEGADGYLLKDAPSDQVVEAVRTVFHGESVIHPSLTRKLLTFHQQNHRKDKEENSLTERERGSSHLSG